MLPFPGKNDRARLNFLETAAIAILAVKSKARLGLANTVFAVFFDALSPLYLNS